MDQRTKLLVGDASRLGKHSAADNLWRETGNLTMAQALLRHESPATTAQYLHPTRQDLEAALEALE